MEYLIMSKEINMGPATNVEKPTPIQSTTNTTSLYPTHAGKFFTAANEESEANIKIKESPRKIDNVRYRRMRRTSYQAKLGKKLDNIASKILDNNIRLSAHPTDMLRIRVQRDERSHDLISRTIESTEIMPIILPVMKDIPLRHFIRENTDIIIPSLYTIDQQEFFEIYSPVECDLNEDDILVRLLYDSSPEINDPYVMVLQVKEVLGNFGYSSLMWKKELVTFYDEKLPEVVVNTIKESILKRELLNW